MGGTQQLIAARRSAFAQRLAAAAAAAACTGLPGLAQCALGQHQAAPVPHHSAPPAAPAHCPPSSGRPRGARCWRSQPSTAAAPCPIGANRQTWTCAGLRGMGGGRGWGDSRTEPSWIPLPRQGNAGPQKLGHSCWRLVSHAACQGGACSCLPSHPAPRTDARPDEQLQVVVLARQHGDGCRLAAEGRLPLHNRLPAGLPLHHFLRSRAAGSAHQISSRPQQQEQERRHASGGHRHS